MPVSLPACDQPLQTTTWATEFLRRHGWAPFADGLWAPTLEQQEQRVPTCEAVHHQVTLLELQLISERFDRDLTLHLAYEALLALGESSAPLILEHFGRPWVSEFVRWLSEVAAGSGKVTGERGGRPPNDFERARASQLMLRLRFLGAYAS